MLKIGIAVVLIVIVGDEDVVVLEMSDQISEHLVIKPTKWCTSGVSFGDLKITRTKFLGAV